MPILPPEAGGGAGIGDLVTSLTDKKIPIWVQGSNRFEDSAMRENATQVVFNKKIKTKATTISIGELDLKHTGDVLETALPAVNERYLVPSVKFDLTNGVDINDSLMYKHIWEEDDSIIQSDDSSTAGVEVTATNDTPGQVQYLITTTYIAFTFWAQKFRFKFTTASNGVRMVIRVGSKTGPIWAETHSEEDKADGVGFTTTATGITEFVLPFPVQIRVNETYYISIENKDNDIDMKGVLGALGEAAEFAPYLERTWNDQETIPIVTAGDPTYDARAMVLYDPTTGATGTITVGSPIITGVLTTFLADYEVGAAIEIDGEALEILSIDTDLQITATSNAIHAGTGLIYRNGDLWGVGNIFGTRKATLDAAGHMTLEEDFTAKKNVIVEGNLIVDGTTTSINSEVVNITDRFLHLNKEHTAAVAETGGIVIATLPGAGTTNTIASGTFTAAVPGTTDAKLTGATDTTYSTGDVIQITGDVDNEGLYEVAIHGAGEIEIKGIGLSPNTLDFVKTDFVAGVKTNITVVRMTVAVIRAGTDGKFEVATGDDALALSYSNLHVDNEDAVVSTLTLNGAFRPRNKTKTANYLITNFDHTIRVDATAGPVTITLPNAGSAPFAVYNIKKIDSSVNAVTVAAVSAQTIDGTLTRVLDSQYDGITIHSFATSWDII